MEDVVHYCFLYIQEFSHVANRAFPCFTLATKEATPLAKENMSHAVSATSPVGAVYRTGLFPA